MEIDAHLHDFRLHVRRCHLLGFLGVLFTTCGLALLIGIPYKGPLQATVLAFLMGLFVVIRNIWWTRGGSRPWYEDSPLFPWATGAYIYAMAPVGVAATGLAIYMIRTPPGMKPIDWNYFGLMAGATALGLGILSLTVGQILLKLWYEIMVGHLAQEIAQSPATVSFRELRAQLNFERHDYREAIPDLEALLKMNSSDGRYLGALARAHAQLDEHNETVAALQRLLRVAPRSGEPLIELAEWRPAEQDRDWELAAWTYTLSHDPKAAHLHAGRGATHESLGLLEEALVDYAKAAELNPSDPYYHCDQAIVLADLGRMQEATQELEIIRRLAGLKVGEVAA